MSQLVVPKYTACSSITTSRRITEIMQEKGKYYSQQAMASRLGYQRTTFRKMLSGTRDIYTFELEQIARDLKVTPERLLQRDMQSRIGELQTYLLELKNLDEALEIALNFHELSIGITEKCDANIYLGRVYFELKKNDLSLAYRLKAFEMAEMIFDIYGETGRYHQALRSLIISYSETKDFYNAKMIVEKASEVLGADDLDFVVLNYSLAMIAYNNGNLSSAREMLYLALESYTKMGDRKEIGKAMHNVAFIEFKLGNLEAAKKRFEVAIHTLEGYRDPQIIAIKDYIKVLLKLGDRNKVNTLISDFMAHSHSFSDRIKTQFYLLQAICNNDPNSAEYVLSMEGADDQHRAFACHFLMDFYAALDDAAALMKYYKIAQTFSLKKSGVMSEEDL